MDLPKQTQRYFLDTEFIEDGRTIDLLSIGVVCQDGREFYAESSEADLNKANEWVRMNVIPHLEGPSTSRYMSRAQIAAELLAFVDASKSKGPEFWAYYGDYDWVVICQLFGTMSDLPQYWPMFCMDVKQMAVTAGCVSTPEQDSVEHNALTDARWTRDLYNYLLTTRGRLIHH